MINASDFNVTKINPQELEEHLKATIAFGGNVFIMGRRGTCKTVVSRKVIRDMGYKELYLNTSICERTEFTGFPRLLDKQENDYVRYLMPDYFKSLIEGNQKVVCLLDEIDKQQDNSNLAPLLEITQFRTINGRHLPNLQACIMTGNLIAEGGNRPPLPLLDRAEKLFVESSTIHWLNWASTQEAQIHPSITAFINDNPTELHGDVDCGEQYADPSPRGWHNASNLIHYGEYNGWSHKLMNQKVSATIGNAAGIRFAVYFDHYQNILPLVKMILEGQNPKGFDNLEPACQITTAMVVCARLSNMIDGIKEYHNNKTKDMTAEQKMVYKKSTPNRLPVQTKFVGKFLNNIDPEMAIISIRSQIGMNRVAESELINDSSFVSVLSSVIKRMKSEG